MNPADEEAAKIEPTERHLGGAVGGSDDSEQLRVSAEDLPRPGPQPKPVDDLQNLLLRISHHLDDEASERKAIYDRLLTTDNQTKRRASRGFARFLLAICIGVAATLAWQSYGEATKRIIATRAPELGWSPEAKHMIASWVERLGWTKQPASPEITAVRPSVPETSQAATVAQTAPETVARTAPAASSLDPEQVQQMTQGLAALRGIVLQLVAGQDRMAREMVRLEAGLVDILVKMPEPPPQPRGR
jgi:hypothetical protein